MFVKDRQFNFGADLIKQFTNSIQQNRNMLMLISACIYIIALFAVLSEHLLLYLSVITLLFISCIISNLFSKKVILIWTLIFYTGIINTNIRLKNTDELLNLAPVNSEITGTIISIPQKYSENKCRFFFDVQKIQIGSFSKTFKNEKTLVSIDSTTYQNTNKDDLKIHNSLLLKGRLAIPFKAGNPSQFDYSNYLRNYNTYSVFYAKNLTKIDTKLTAKQKILQKINDCREQVISIHSNYLKSPNLEILGGIVFGDDAISPPQDIKNSFINSGLLHILAASGMNVAFIYGFFFFIMSKLRVNFKISIISGMVMVLIYCLMTGMGASVIRATIMLLFVLVGKLIDRDAHSIALLSFVALLMLLYNPLYINDVGFQLSFIVTFGLLLTTPLLITFKSKVLNYLVSMITIPIIAQLWVIPIQIFYFNNISLYAILANIMSVPILAVLSFGGFISSLLSIIFTNFAHYICYIFDFILNPFITFLIFISDFCGNLPHASLQTAHPNVLQVFMYYLLLIFAILLCYKEYRQKFRKFIICAILSLIILLGISFININQHELEILTFDVGNADCFLIKTPENKYFMIDTAKAGYDKGKSQAEFIILKYLKDNGIKNLDFIILTHFDNDHSGGAVDIMKEIYVGKIYVNNLDDKSKSAKEIYATAHKTNTKLIQSENNTLIYKENGITVKNYQPHLQNSDNDNSTVTLLSYNKFNMLFTGDAGVLGLQSVINYLPQNIKVLKVPHHGAVGGLNKAIIKYLNPKYSIISVGENKFGHPSQYTLALLNHSEILRTDIVNSILIKVDKNNYKILQYTQKKKKYCEIIQK